MAGIKGPGASKAIMAPCFPFMGHQEEDLVPYKDLEKRRVYQREYKRRLRAQQGLTSRGQTQVRKAYICLKFPQLRLLPGIVFLNGWLVTDDLEVQARIEQDPDYGRHIFSWRLEP
jgi:hypothetical protein